MWLAVTVVVFLLSRQICQKFKTPVMNPLLLSIVILIPMLIVLHVPFATYAHDNRWINQLLQPAVVALAYPLYEQLPQIRANWRIILLASGVGSVMSMLTAGFIAVALHTDLTLVASLMGKSVTTPIAMEVASHLGGEASIAAVLVLLVGLFGSIVAYPIYKWLNISQSVARGLTMGTVSHALGTSTCADNNPQDAAFSSLALVLCGVITSIIAPSLFTFFVWLSALN